MSAYDMVDDRIILENIKGNFFFTLNDDSVFSLILFILDCKDGFYGKECSEKCICKPENTETCGNVSGICTCRAGWNGTDCSVDVDECKTNANICPDNSNCTNLNGTYLCTCKDGFSMSNNKCTGKLALLFYQILISLLYIKCIVSHKYMYMLVEF